MKRPTIFTRASASILSALALIVATSSTAFAHVTVKPAAVATASYQVFTVNVPNEKDIPTVSVRVTMPGEVTGVTPTAKAGWKVTTEKQGEGEDAKVTSITWSDGAIADGLRDEFSFSAKTPDAATDLKWKAYQTYADGTVVSWDKEDSGGGHGEAADSGPLSVTTVSKDVATDDHHASSASGAADAQSSADRAFYVGIAGIVVGLVALYLATRRP